MGGGAPTFTLSPRSRGQRTEFAAICFFAYGSTRVDWRKGQGTPTCQVAQPAEGGRKRVRLIRSDGAQAPGKTRTAEREKARDGYGTPTSGTGIARERETRADGRCAPPTWVPHPLTIPDGATVHRLQQRKRAVLRWCWAHGYVEQNVAGEGIEGALPAMPAVKAHFRALPYREVAAALETVDGSKASVAARLCFRFLVLTAARSGEARGARLGARWMDSEAREWRIPGERT